MDTIAIAAEHELNELIMQEELAEIYVGEFCEIWDNPNLTDKEREDMIPF